MSLSLAIHRERLNPVPKRTDANHSQVMDLYRQMGCSVRSTHTLAHGFPDVCVGHAGGTALVEIKDGSKPPSKRRLTPDEQKFADEWLGSPVRIVMTAADVVEQARRIRTEPLYANSSHIRRRSRGISAGQGVRGMSEVRHVSDAWNRRFFWMLVMDFPILRS